MSLEAELTMLIEQADKRRASFLPVAELRDILKFWCPPCKPARLYVRYGCGHCVEPPKGADLSIYMSAARHQPCDACAGSDDPEVMYVTTKE